MAYYLKHRYTNDWINFKCPKMIVLHFKIKKKVFRILIKLCNTSSFAIQEAIRLFYFIFYVKLKKKLQDTLFIYFKANSLSILRVSRYLFLCIMQKWYPEKKIGWSVSGLYFMTPAFCLILKLIGNHMNHIKHLNHTQYKKRNKKKTLSLHSFITY